jgi:hypothetical protein
MDQKEKWEVRVQLGLIFCVWCGRKLNSPEEQHPDWCDTCCLDCGDKRK